MPNIEVQRNLSLVDIARRLSPDKRKLLFQWTANNGPFIEDDRPAIDDDLFQFEEQDVTDLGLGEAARRILASRSAATFSPVQDIESRFAANPLTVVHGLVEEPIARVPVANFRKADELANALLRSMPTPRTWAELLDGCRERFDRLRISDYCDSALARHPYHPPAGRRIIELLDILQRMMNQMNNEGTLSEAGMKLRSTFFTGKTAWFSDESETRKRSPKAFTFPDPDGEGTLVCFWHGKISTPAFRVHFEWPASPPFRRLRIVYIGPHLNP